ncbi:MAG: lysozyme [Proteobacteria bacterium]|nr:lysozyme [Pseudomonadota bacterium]
MTLGWWRQLGRVSRTLVASIAIPASLLVGVIVNEGYCNPACIPAQGDKPTLGFGNTTHADGRPVRLGDTTTPVKALQRTLLYLQKADAEMKATLVGVELHPAEYEVYYDWRYQFGIGAWKGSDMLRHLRAGEYVAACDALLQYRKMTSARKEGAGWVPSRKDAAGNVLRWEFDCSTPGNRVCMGVWTRQLERHQKCMAVQ